MYSTCKSFNGLDFMSNDNGFIRYIEPNDINIHAQFISLWQNFVWAWRERMNSNAYILNITMF